VIWQFLDTGYHTGEYNMEFDRLLARQLNEGAIAPTLRFYGWQPYAISIGYHQDINDFDLQKLQQRGCDIVRRPTGGKAIFHAHEVTYSVVTTLQNHTPREVYRFINECLLEGLRFFGIDATLSDSESDLRTLYKDASSLPCFSSTAKSEIQVHGKKLVGSAQRKIGTILLQHGSLLLGSDHKKITEFLAPHAHNTKGTLDSDLEARTIEIETIVRHPVSYEEIVYHLRRGFEVQGNIMFTEHPQLAEELIPR
jgi:lipoate-protein ligase A